MDGDSGSASQEPETSGLSTRPSSVGGDTGEQALIFVCNVQVFIII